VHAYVHGVKSEISLDTGFFTPLQDYGCVFYIVRYVVAALITSLTSLVQSMDRIGYPAG